MKYTQSDMDAIIAKLGEQGYDGLSKEEKQVLFHKQINDAKSTRYDSKPELLLTIIVLFELVIHGIQRIVLSAQLPLYMKLGSVSQNSTLNIVLGLFAVLFFGLLFVLALKDTLAGKVYFIRHGFDRKSTLKYLGKLSFMLLIILWMTATIISYWPAFVNKLF
jgi:hypothetical protein